MTSAFSTSWAKCWEVYLGVALLIAGPWLTHSHPFGLADGAIWFGAIVLGTGLLRDLWALLVTRAAHGDGEVAMCAESIVGVAAIAGGLIFVVVPFCVPGLMQSHAPWTVRDGTIGAFLGFCLIFSAWVHDLVFVKRGGKIQLLRHPDHGSFVVHFFRGEAKACMMPPPAGEAEV